MRRSPQALEGAWQKYARADQLIAELATGLRAYRDSTPWMLDARLDEERLVIIVRPRLAVAPLARGFPDAPRPPAQAA